MEHGMLIKYDSTVFGYAIDLYRYHPSIGLKMSKLKNYLADIEQVIGKSGIRILAPIPNSTLIGFEIPKEERYFPKEIPDTEGFELAIGYDIYGNLYKYDLRKAPHILVAGATGSGKSVFLNSIITQLSAIPEVDSIIQAKLFNGLKEYYLDQGIDYRTFSTDVETEDKLIGILSSQKVGPTIADDIRNRAFMAIFFALIVIFVYNVVAFPEYTASPAIYRDINGSFVWRIEWVEYNYFVIGTC